MDFSDEKVVVVFSQLPGQVAQELITNEITESMKIVGFGNRKLDVMLSEVQAPIGTSLVVMIAGQFLHEQLRHQLLVDQISRRCREMLISRAVGDFLIQVVMRNMIPGNSYEVCAAVEDIDYKELHKHGPMHLRHRSYTRKGRAL